MMKSLAILFSVFVLQTGSEADFLNQIRKNYDRFVSDKELCRKTVSELEKTKTSSATFVGYLGALQTIQANHVVSPISKLKTFNKGKKNIELAIKKEPDNIELRLIRLSVQKNAPAFLGYQSSIQEDLAFIRKNKSQVKSDVLKNNIEKILKD